MTVMSHERHRTSRHQQSEMKSEDRGAVFVFSEERWEEREVRNVVVIFDALMEDRSIDAGRLS